MDVLVERFVLIKLNYVYKKSLKVIFSVLCFTGTCQNYVKTDKTDRNAGFVCACLPGYVGERCDAAMKEQQLAVSNAAIVAIVVCGIILLGEKTGFFTTHNNFILPFIFCSVLIMLHHLPKSPEGL